MMYIPGIDFLTILIKMIGSSCCNNNIYVANTKSCIS